ncbi:hypothetical protein BGZ65_003615 [Modicella reniformis]|uniref:Uncharacterized protein n=1 Tax=Modicella reniformis TaxID=1440133 RepID=A0A9P6SMG5_9FUNG|nr:hypothetical protein BGZ65_003615 [Modicella reniformis]
MTTSPLPMDTAIYPISLASYLAISTQEHLRPSSECSPSAATNPMSPRISPVLSSPPSSPELRQHTSSSADITQQTSESQCLTVQQQRLHQQYQQQMCKQPSEADHSSYLSSPESAQRYQQQLALQLEYYKQLQIMHCQRARDIELLHLQQQQLQQQQPQSLQMVKKFQLAQGMLQMQQVFHAQQIQKIQYLQKMNHLQRPSTPVAEAEQLPSQRGDSVSEEDIARLEIDPNTLHIPTKPSSRSRLDLQQFLGTTGNPHVPSSSSRRSRVQELSRIVLPSPDQIRRLRHQRLKHQARLRQLAAVKAKAVHQHQPCATVDTATNVGGTADDDNGSQLKDQEMSPSATLKTPSSLITTKVSQITKQVQATVWTSSTTSVMTRSKADLQYKKQLRHNMALQQHMIQDHTHRYRIFQAFCLLQRAREAQALDELQTQKRRQLQTLAWVEALRNSKELEIPQ